MRNKLFRAVNTGNSAEKKHRFLSLIIAGIIFTLLLLSIYLKWKNRSSERINFLPIGNKMCRILEHNDKVAEIILQQMTDREKIGQIIFAGIGGKKINSRNARFVRDMHVGGIILFDENMKYPEQVRNLTDSLQEFGSLVKNTGDTSVKVPVFIAVDQEGGSVVRMRKWWPHKIPSEEEIAATANSMDCKNMAEKVSDTLWRLGINVNFAPVLDAELSDNRSYSANSKINTEFGKAAAEGYIKKGILPTLKHFPGIGGATNDPHKGKSVVCSDIGSLMDTNIAPFAEIIKALNNKEFLVMVSNVTYPGIDNKNPACFSRRIVTEVLRKGLGFKGIIVTDDLNMGSISRHYPIDQWGIRAVKAGADMVLIADMKTIPVVIEELLRVYRTGEIKKEVDDAVKRILVVKLSYIGSNMPKSSICPRKFE